jgi:Helicase conserved C-terminal domain/SNF2-related domain
MPSPAPSSRSVLSTLPKARLVDLGRNRGVQLEASKTKDEQLDALLGTGLVRFGDLLAELGRDELKAACRAHGLDDSGRARQALASRLLGAHGAAESAPPPSAFKAYEIPRYAPHPGDIVACRHRQWLVEDVVPPPEPRNATRVRMVCLDDDNAGRVLEVLWELELGARVLQPEAHGLGSVARLDPPRRFGAYLHALKWSSVTATDAKLFQAPFRAGIHLLDYQLTPLFKALSLPRANLFIADDVGLGKTVEAGLVLSELLLRQRVEFVLIVCPASVCLQWQSEMEKRFGLHFDVMTRQLIARRRQERGFGVNPWTTHNRFIISHPLVRRPEYRDPLLQHVGERAKKSLLILDEAHVAAPASKSKYAIDSRITRVVRDIAPRFENRLFLSATPHNGHSNSFSALLEILDPQRFTRGVRVESADELVPVMVRRLKSDLRELGSHKFPERKLVRISLRPDDAPEVRLAHLLAEYTALMKPARGRGKLVFVNLQKRLLSSVEAFSRTLGVHARWVADKTGAQLDLDETVEEEREGEDEVYGEDDDTAEKLGEAADEAASRLLQTAAGRARELLAEMQALAARARLQPDAKMHALIDWIREHQCAAVQVGGAARGSDRKWSDRRLLIFTEYGDTKRYLRQILTAAVDGTDRADERILELHGGMGDEQRDAVQRAFNSQPDDHPVRILIATDAAREGINLQGHCADLFHFDIPWNPARLEQRNGRIDRTLQPEPEVRCHYFIYPERGEDIVLDKLVEKVDVIQRELGSLGAVLMERIDGALEDGIGKDTEAQLELAGMPSEGERTTQQELESQRTQDRLKREREEIGGIIQRSERVLDFRPELLREAIDVGLELAGAGPLERDDASTQETAVWRVPDLPQSWARTLDSLRVPRERDEPFWEWRKRPLVPVVFEAPERMNDALAQLHLQHPFVQRILGRFLAQGYSAHDLSRVTLIQTRRDQLARVIAFGRLSLFGASATRLHDELVSVAARWVESSDAPLKPFEEDADKKAIELLEQTLAEAPELDAVSPKVRERVLAAAPRLFQDLWRHIRDEADARSKAATDQLATRGREEAEALRRILKSQRAAIERELGRRAQLAFEFTDGERDQRDQFEQDKHYMEQRLKRIEKEIESEPPEIEALYKVVLPRLEPVGLVVLWPEVRG